MSMRGLLIVSLMIEVVTGCSPTKDEGGQLAGIEAGRKYLLERIDDVAVAQIYADGFEALSLREKVLTWHLYQAALAGRDIFYDQRYEHNLEMREVLEEIITHPDTRRWRQSKDANGNPSLHEALLD